MNFPVIAGVNLKRVKKTLPADFDGNFNIILIAFQQWQQRQVDSWIPFVKQLEGKYSGLAYYELPTIQQRNVLTRTLINEGMRAGIPDPFNRERTITLYIEKKKFREALNIPNENDIVVMLIDRTGKVFYKVAGIYSAENGDTLEQAIRDAFRHDEHNITSRIKELLQKESFAVLCTHGEGQPYGSVVAYAYTTDLQKIVFATPIATRKFRNLVECERVALVVDSRDRYPGQLHSVEAVTITGRAQHSMPEEMASEYIHLLVARHPDLKSFCESTSTAVFRVDAAHFIYVTRFQDVYHWSPMNDNQ